MRNLPSKGMINQAARKLQNVTMQCYVKWHVYLLIHKYKYKQDQRKYKKNIKVVENLAPACSETQQNIFSWREGKTQSNSNR